MAPTERTRTDHLTLSRKEIRQRKAAGSRRLEISEHDYCEYLVFLLSPTLNAPSHDGWIGCDHGSRRGLGILVLRSN